MPMRSRLASVSSNRMDDGAAPVEEVRQRQVLLVQIVGVGEKKEDVGLQGQGFLHCGRMIGAPLRDLLLQGLSDLADAVGGRLEPAGMTRKQKLAPGCCTR